MHGGSGRLEKLTTLHCFLVLNNLLADSSPFIAFVVAIFGVRLLLSRRLSNIVLDTPNHRSLHKQPIPRTGGVALMAGILAGWAWGNVPVWVVAPVIGLMAVSFWDDARGLSVKWRLLAHFLAAGVLLVLGLPNAHDWLWLVLMLPAMVWAINLYNFMDGADGLAGGMALFGFGVYGLAAASHGESGFALMNFTVVAAAAAFLAFNFHPARIFLGDAGSIPLGFLAAAFGLSGWDMGLWQGWFPLLVFSPFVADASATLLKRLMHGDKIWLAHREHYYQRLVQSGWGHGKVALVEYGLMAAVGGSSLWGMGQGTGVQLALCLAWLLVFLGSMAWVDKHWKKFVLQEKSH